jgi:hypothetical protein
LVIGSEKSGFTSGGPDDVEMYPEYSRVPSITVISHQFKPPIFLINRAGPISLGIGRAK